MTMPSADWATIQFSCSCARAAPRGNATGTASEGAGGSIRPLASAKPGIGSAVGGAGACATHAACTAPGEGRGSARNDASVAAPPVEDARCPAPAKAWRSADTTSPRAASGSRNRTSALAGCTFTSTPCGSQDRNSTAAGCRPDASTSKYPARSAPVSSLSRTGRPLTYRCWATAAPRE